MIQGLRFHAPNPGGPGSIPGQGTKSHTLQLKILHAATKTWCPPNKFKKRKKYQKELKCPVIGKWQCGTRSLHTEEHGSSC